MKETEVAAPVVEHLQAAGYTVYKEVLCPREKRVVDVYGLRNATHWAVEVKTSLSMTVLEQADYWTKYSDLVSIAVPQGRSRRALRFASKICRLLNLGLLIVSEAGVREERRPMRKGAISYPMLYEEQKRSVAGTKDGSRWSPYKETCKKLRLLVAAHPNITLRNAIQQLSHHYAHERSAYSSLKKHLRKGNVPGVTYRRKRKRYHLRLRK